MQELEPNFWTPDRKNKLIVYGIVAPALALGTLILISNIDDPPDVQSVEIVKDIPAQVENKGIKHNRDHPDDKRSDVRWLDLEQCNDGNEAENPKKLHGRTYDPAIGSVAVGCAFQRIPVDRETYTKARVGYEMTWPGKSDQPITVAG